MKRIYISGCGGMLGEAFYIKYKNEYCLKCTDIALNEPWLSYTDIREYAQYKNDVVSFLPDFLFHFGAHTDLEYCENNANDAYLTNTIAVENAVYIANLLDIPLIFISTAGIFDGLKESYDDWDKPNPLGIYAKSKYYGERFVVENSNRYLICRAGWMMGGGPNKDKKFVNKIIKQIKSGANKLYVVNDKLGTPTYTHNFADNLMIILKNELWGLYNMVCNGFTSRLEVAQEILSNLGMTQKIELIEVPSTYFQKDYFAPRPESERLINKKLDLRGINIMSNWKESLSEYLNSYYCNYL